MSNGSALVTGASGFLGRHLVAHLCERGVDVVALSRDGKGGGPGTRRVCADVCDRSVLASVLADGVDIVYHLAFSRVRPALMAVTALEGTAAVLDEAARAPRPPRVVLVSSSAVYGFSSGAEPLSEDVPPAPATYYGVVKHAQEVLAASYVRGGGLDVVTVRPFNLLGPGEDGALVTGSLALQIARGERSGAPFAVQVGNLEAFRDYIDVRDAASGVAAAAECAAAGELYNVCTGVAVQIRAVVDVLRRFACVPFELTPRAGATFGPDIPFQVGSGARLHGRSGWKPRLTLEDSLRDLLTDVRERAEADAA